MELEVVCFDCPLVDRVDLDEPAAIRLAQSHSDEHRHHLVVQQWRGARCIQLWSVRPLLITEH